MTTFIVKLRSQTTRSWGDQNEVQAESAQLAAEKAAGEPLRHGPGERSALRARVWALPYDSGPDTPFYSLALVT